jgi:hypothetical protein
VRRHARDALLERCDVGGPGGACGERGDLALDQLARVEELEGAGSFAATTKMPVPTRTSTSPLISSEMMASRTDVRDTPSETASSRSAGSRVPGGNSPRAMSSAS